MTDLNTMRSADRAGRSATPADVDGVVPHGRAVPIDPDGRLGARSPTRKAPNDRAEGTDPVPYRERSAHGTDDACTPGAFVHVGDVGTGNPAGHEVHLGAVTGLRGHHRGPRPKAVDPPAFRGRVDEVDAAPARIGRAGTTTAPRPPCDRERARPLPRRPSTPAGTPAAGRDPDDAGIDPTARTRSPSEGTTMQPYYRNDRGVIAIINGVAHNMHGYANGRHDIRNAITGMPYVQKGPDGVVGMLTDEAFDGLLDSGDLEIVSARSPDRVRLLNDASAMTIAQAKEVDPGVERRLIQVELLDAARVKNGIKAIGTFLDRDGGWTEELQAKWGDHDLPRTLKEWRATRGVEGCRHASQMIRLNGRLARSRWTEVEEETVWKHVLAHKTTPGGVPGALALYRDEVALVNEGRHPVHPAPEKSYEAVSERTFYRRVRQFLDAETEATKSGKQALEQDWAGAGRPLTADHAMQRVIVDHTRLDVFVVDDERELVLGRPWLTLAIDVRTRAIVAHVVSFVSPSIWTVGEILRRMALPKRPPGELAKRHPILRRLRGRPDQIIVDNATEFRSLSFEAAARGLGFSIRYCPVRKPRYRAIVERGIGTANAGICGEMRGRVLPIAEARRLDYDGESEAVVIMDELEAVANWWVAEYNTHPHPGIRQQAPASFFEREAARTGIMNFRDLRRFRLETMDIVPEAQVDAGGVTRWGLRWHHFERVPELLNDLVKAEPGRRRRQDAAATIMFRYDPMDLARIWVWNRISQDYVELECADEEYARGMPLAFHLDLQKRATDRKLRFTTSAERIAVRSRRIAAIRSIDPKAKARSRDAVARLLEIPRLKAITGNIVDLDVRSSHPDDFEGFITADPASYTALDMEILGRRQGIEDGGTPPDPTAEPDGAGPATIPARRGRLTRGGLR